MQRSFEVESRQRSLVHLRVIKGERPATVFLGAVHRRIRIPEEFIRALAIAGIDGDANRDADSQFVFIDPHRAHDRIENAARDNGCILGRRNLRQNDGELVPAHAKHQFAAAQARLDACRDRFQQQVTRVMPEAVVNDFEAVEVEEHQGAGVAVARGHRDRLVESLREVRSVRQARECVVIGLMTNLVLLCIAVLVLARNDETGLAHHRVQKQVQQGQCRQHSGRNLPLHLTLLL